MPYLDQPALERSPDDEPGGRRVKVDRRSEVWVPFMDGTLRSCRVIEWRQDNLGWWCLLRWGAAGRLTEAWYRYDKVRVEPLGETDQEGLTPW